VVENVNGFNTGNVSINIPKHSDLTTTYDSTMTSIEDQAVNNADWSFEESDTDYILTYTAHDSNFTPESESYIGLEMDFTAPAAQRGKIPIKVTVQGSPAGDIDSSNDVDEDFLIYNNL
jgi:hypothetical protein